jgi:hypothetical protein
VAASSEPLPGRRAGARGRSTGSRATHPRWWAPQRLTLEGDISPIHDPAIIRQGGTYHVFASNRFAGEARPMFCSTDRRRWTLCGNVFDAVPEWALQEVPGAERHLGPGHLVLRGPVSSVLLGLDVRQEPVRHRPDHEPHARSEESRLPMGGRRQGRRLHARGRLERHRSEPGRGRAGDTLARLGQLLGAGSRCAGSRRERASSPRPDPMLYSLASRRPLGAALDRGTLHRQEGQLFLPLRVLRHVLPGQGQHLQDHGRAGEEDHGPLYR